VDLKNERESKNFVDHTTYLNQMLNKLDTRDKMMFWRMMHQSDDDNYISHITNPNVEPGAPQLEQPQSTTDFLNSILLHLMTGK
jgi:hypothetical protein